MKERGSKEGSGWVVAIRRRKRGKEGRTEQMKGCDALCGTGRKEEGGLRQEKERKRRR